MTQLNELQIEKIKVLGGHPATLANMYNALLEENKRLNLIISAGLEQSADQQAKIDMLKHAGTVLLDVIGAPTTTIASEHEEFVEKAEQQIKH